MEWKVTILWPIIVRPNDESNFSRDKMCSVKKERLVLQWDQLKLKSCEKKNKYILSMFLQWAIGAEPFTGCDNTWYRKNFQSHNEAIRNIISFQLINSLWSLKRVYPLKNFECSITQISHYATKQFAFCCSRNSKLFIRSPESHIIFLPFSYHIQSHDIPEWMKRSIFHGNIILFLLMIVMISELIKWCFLKQTVRIIYFRKENFNYFCHCQENLQCICSEWSSAQVSWCVAYCMRYMIHSNKFEHKEYLEVFIHWIAKKK